MCWSRFKNGSWQYSHKFPSNLEARQFLIRDYLTKFNKKSLLVCNMDHKLPSCITRLALTHFIMYVARNEAKMNNYCSREEKYTNLECFKSVMKYEDNKLSISFFFLKKDQTFKFFHGLLRNVVAWMNLNYTFHKDRFSLRATSVKD